MSNGLNIVRMFDNGVPLPGMGTVTFFETFGGGLFVKAGQPPHAKNDFSTSPYHSKNLWYTY